MNNKKMDEPPVQSPLRLFGGVLTGGYVTHPRHEVMACADDADVIIGMMRADRVKGRRDGFYADHLGIDRSLWSRMLSGKARCALTESEWMRLQELTRSKLYRQWTALSDGCDLIPHKETPEEELDRLRRENALLAQQRA